jgi:hypothetical protein
VAAIRRSFEELTRPTLRGNEGARYARRVASRRTA